MEYETSDVRSGADAIAENLANIVLVNILRVYLASLVGSAQTHTTSWLGALKDAQIGEALTRMHADVAKRWKVEHWHPGWVCHAQLFVSASRPLWVFHHSSTSFTGA